MIEFLQPGFLSLALLAPLAWFLPRRIEDPRFASLRAAAVVLLALAAARPVRVGSDDHRAPLHVVRS
ncbi:MAG: hypothetical protein ACF8XB_21615, partial [Planctomycetota bacterium JB042]